MVVITVPEHILQIENVMNREGKSRSLENGLQMIFSVLNRVLCKIFVDGCHSISKSYSRNLFFGPDLSEKLSFQFGKMQNSYTIYLLIH